MSKRPSSISTKVVNLHGFTLAIVLLAALTGLTSCGGTGGSFRQISGGGGGGGGGGNGTPCTAPSPITTTPATKLGVETVGSSSFMDLHVGGSGLLNTVSIPYGSLRLWDTGTGWAEINTGFGQYSWASLDGWVGAQPSGVDLLYNLGRTPHWASSNASDSTCAYSDISGGNGQCWPPTDLNSDGSGTDQDWITWVTDVASRYKGQIKYYEIWNEWNIGQFWQGTPAQLVRMEQDARCVVEGPPAGMSCNPNSTFTQKGIDPSARIVTPSPVGAHTDLNEVSLKLASYFGTTVGGVPGGTFADVIGFHGYVGTKSGVCPNPEEVTTVVDLMNSTVQSFGEGGKPWFNTEGGWSQASSEGFTDPDRQAAFLARYFLLQRSLGVDRMYWYRWDGTSTYLGALWSSSSGPTEAADAWSEVSKWINGGTLSTACTAKGSVWSCGFTRTSPVGYLALAVWDAGKDCTSTSCPTSDYTVPVGYTQYLDLTGTSTSTSAGATIQIGAKPILLENGTLP